MFAAPGEQPVGKGEHMHLMEFRVPCALALVMAATWSSGCDPSESAGDAGAGGAGGTGGVAPITEDDVAVTIASTCVYGEQLLADQAAVDAVESCLYRRESRLLNVRLRGDNSFIQVEIVGFAGTGDYTTGDTEETTSVTLDGPDQDADDPGVIFSWAGETQPAARCDLVVMNTNLPEVVIEPERPAYGHVALQGTCLKLNGAAVTDYVCSLSPVDFEFAVARCEVSAD